MNLDLYKSFAKIPPTFAAAIITRSGFLFLRYLKTFSWLVKFNFFLFIVIIFL